MLKKPYCPFLLDLMPLIHEAAFQMFFFILKVLDKHSYPWSQQVASIFGAFIVAFTNFIRYNKSTLKKRQREQQFFFLNIINIHNFNPRYSKHFAMPFGLEYEIMVQLQLHFNFKENRTTKPPLHDCTFSLFIYLFNPDISVSLQSKGVLTIQ